MAISGHLISHPTGGFFHIKEKSIVDKCIKNTSLGSKGEERSAANVMLVVTGLSGILSTPGSTGMGHPGFVPGVLYSRIHRLPLHGTSWVCPRSPVFQDPWAPIAWDFL